MKIKAYIGLSEGAKNLNLMNRALAILKRALQFVWKLKDEEAECEIYDKMGVVYYQLGDVEKATFYHEKSINGIVTPQDSEIVRISNENVDTYRSSVHTKEAHITTYFVNRLQLPTKSNISRIANISKISSL